MASSSAALDYPSSGEYNVLVQRFKLLNLVQRVAHRDVSEMIDTVGLDSLARKGTLSRWIWENDDERGNLMDNGPVHFTGYGRYTAQRNADTQRYRGTAATRAQRRTHNTYNNSAGTFSPPLTHGGTPRSVSPLPPPRMSFGRSTTGFEAQLAAARANSNGVEEDNDETSRAYGVTRRVVGPSRQPTRDGRTASQESTRRRYVVRRTQRVLRGSPADRDAFFSRLAEPRSRLEPVVEDVLVFDAADDAPGYRSRRGDREGMKDRFHSGGSDGRRDGVADEQQSWARAQRSAYDDYEERSRRGVATAPPAPLPASSVGASRRHPGAGRPAQLDAATDLRAHYYGASPVYPPHTRSPAQPGEGRYDTDYPSARGEVGDDRGEDGDAELPAPLPRATPSRQPAPLHEVASGSSGVMRQSGDGEGAGPHDMEFTPPPTRPNPASRGSAAAAVVSSADGPVRRRSVNFALSEEDEYEGSPTGANALPLPGNYVVPSSLNNVHGSPVGGGASDVFAATAPAAVAGGRGGPDAATPAVPQLHFPQAGGSAYGDVDDVGSGGLGAPLNVPGSGRSGLMGASATSVANSPAGLKGRSASGVAGFPKSPRVGRGLAPKAKPKGAMDDSQVPVEAVRHAAALITRSGSTPGSGASPATTSPGNSFPASHNRSPQPQVSSARTPPAASGFSGGGILLSPRPSTVNVNADRQQQQQQRQTNGDGGAAAAFPAAPMSPASAAGAAGVASRPDSVPATPRVLSATDPVTSSVPMVGLVSVDNSAVAAAGANATLPPVDEGAQRSFQAVSSHVNHMLQNLQRVLQRVFKDGDAASAGAAPQGGAAASGQDTYTTSSFEESSNKDTSHAEYDAGDAEETIEVDLDSNSDPIVDEEEDEMLLYTRIQHKVSRLGAEMKQVRLPNTGSSSSSNNSYTNTEGSGGYSDAAGADMAAARAPSASAEAGGSASGLRTGRSQALSRPPPRRARGEVPDAVVKRLCAYRMEHFQYIAYNERLWNTSTTSQFVFAQRLTAALLEECWAEVMAEVDANMSEYVEGLVDHELQ